MALTEKQRKILSGVGLAVLIAAICYLVLKYLMPLIYPFVIAWVVALILQPVINFLTNKARFPKKLAVLILVLAVVFLLGFIAYQIVDRVYWELKALVVNIGTFVDDIRDDPERVERLINQIAEKIPFIDARAQLRSFWSQIDEIIPTILGPVVSDINNITPVLNAVMAVPKVLVDIIIILVSSFYFSNDFKRINSFVVAQLPDKVIGYGRIVKKEFFSTTGKYIRAYGLIILITFAELFIMFSILGVKYAFLIALLTAFIDILPVLGTGTVIIPWAIYCLVTGNYYMGVGLFITYLLITVVRQIIEPKIVGSYIGLYPVVTLICMYVGMKLMGIFGLFLLPITVIILKNLNDAGVIKLWKTPPETEPETSPKKKPTLFGGKRNIARKDRENPEKVDK